MKISIVVCAVALALEAHHAFAADPYMACSELGRKVDGLAIPGNLASASSGVRGIFSAGRVCFRGRDITSWAVGPGRTITSAVRAPYGKSEAVIEAAPTIQGQTAQLVRVFESAQTGDVERQVLMESRATATPETSVERFLIVDFDKVTGILYFETPSWATSSAIWAVKWPVNNWMEPLRPWFVTSGSVAATSIASDMQKWDLLVQKDEIEGANGRVPKYYIYKSNGTRICQVKVDAVMRIEPTCLSRP